LPWLTTPWIFHAIGVRACRDRRPQGGTTWNLERVRTPAIRAGQQAVLRDVHADVVVLTEPGPRYRSGPGVVTSPPARRQSRAAEPWVAIVGSRVEPVPLDVPYERLAVAARVSVGERAFVVYGAVLPWLAVTHHAPELALPGEDFAAILFRRRIGSEWTGCVPDG
jgi:hypothetical protein